MQQEIKPMFPQSLEYRKAICLKFDHDTRCSQLNGTLIVLHMLAMYTSFHAEPEKMNEVPIVMSQLFTLQVVDVCACQQVSRAFQQPLCMLYL